MGQLEMLDSITSQTKKLQDQIQPSEIKIGEIARYSHGDLFIDIVKKDGFVSKSVCLYPYFFTI